MKAAKEKNKLRSSYSVTDYWKPLPEKRTIRSSMFIRIRSYGDVVRYVSIWQVGGQIRRPIAYMRVETW